MAALDELNHVHDWDRQDYPAQTVLRRTHPSPSELVANALSTVGVLERATVQAEFGTCRLLFSVLANGEVISDNDGADISPGNFAVELLDQARSAAAGDLASADGLGGSWTAVLEVAPARLLRLADEATNWFVLNDVHDVCEFLGSEPFWRLGRLLPQNSKNCVVVRHLEAEEYLASGVVEVVSLRRPREVGRPSQTERPAARLPDAREPDSLIPTVQGSALRPVADALLAMAVASAWASLATSLNPSESGLVAEYLGYQKVEFTLPAAGLTRLEPAECEAALELAQWGCGPGSVDRLLAVRQVVSLRAGGPPWASAAEIRRAAEPIFLALRSGAVAEAMQTRREAFTAALSAAQDTAKASSEVTKSAVERCLAAILAVGGVMVAQSTSNLTDIQAAQLRDLIGFGMVALAVWHLVIERPALMGILESFRADLPHFSDLLSEEDQEKLSDLATLKDAQSRACWGVVAVMAAYLSSGVLAFTLG